MKIRALLMAAMMIVGVLGLSAPAQAWTADSSYSELSFPTYTDNNFNVVLSGRIQPAAAGRPVSLQANGAYAAQVTTDAYGRFSFVRNVTSPTTFKFFSAKQPVGANFYGPAGTGEYTVYPAPPVVRNSSFSSVSVPNYTDIDNRVTITGNLGPGGGRQVTFYKQHPDGSNDTYITATNTDANGWFSFTTSIFEPRKFRFYTQRVPAGPNTYFENASYVTGVVSPPTTQPSSYSELSFPATAAYNGAVTLSGRILPAAASRQVNLYRDGAYFKTTYSDSNGRFSFPDVVITNRASFKFFSAKHKVNNGLYYDGQGTPEYVVDKAPARTTSVSDLSTPEFTQSSDNRVVTISGSVSQAAAGRVVSLYKTDGARVAGATTDASGRFVISDVPVPTLTQFHLWSDPHSVNGITYGSFKSSSFWVKSLRFQEDFNYANTSFIGMPGSGAKWMLREPAPRTVGARTRSVSSNDPDVIAMDTDGGRTVIRLGLKYDQATNLYETGHIYAPVDLDSGGFEAKVKFHNFTGAQSAFWLTSGVYDTSGTHHEFDIGERYRAETGVLKHNVYRNYQDAAGNNLRETYGTLNPTYTSNWWNEYHLVAGKWNMNGYWIQVDDGPWERIDTLNGWVGTQRPVLVLSTLINDGRIDELPPEVASDPNFGLANGMSVDWVKTWQ